MSEIEVVKLFCGRNNTTINNRIQNEIRAQNNLSFEMTFVQIQPFSI